MSLHTDRAAFEERLRGILAAHRAGAAADAIAPLIRCAIRVVRTPLAENELPSGASRLGGQPDLPADFAWPMHEGEPLGFLGQFNLRDLNGLACASALPADGQLAFFYDWTREPWGFDPKDRTASLVVYVPDGPLVRHPLPGALADFDSPSPATFEPLFTIPRLDAQAFDWQALGVDAESIDWYELDEALRELRPARPQHQLLGHPYRVQNPMETECQFVSSGLYCGDETGYEKGAADAALMAGIGDWMLLFQCDSDDTGYDDPNGPGIGHMWGDCGLLYFWVRRQDVAQRDFTRTWTILQCG